MSFYCFMSVFCLTFITINNFMYYSNFSYSIIFLKYSIPLYQINTLIYIKVSSMALKCRIASPIQHRDWYCQALSGSLCTLWASFLSLYSPCLRCVFHSLTIKINILLLPSFLSCINRFGSYWGVKHSEFFIPNIHRTTSKGKSPGTDLFIAP